MVDRQHLAIRGSKRLSYNLHEELGVSERQGTTRELHASGVMHGAGVKISRPNALIELRIPTFPI